MNIRSFVQKFVLPLTGWYCAALIFLAATTIITVYIPTLVSQIINSLGELTLESKGKLTFVCLTITALGILQILTRALSRVFIFWPARRIEAQTRSFLFEKMLGLPYSFFATNPPGDILSRITQDTGDIRTFFAIGILNLFSLFFVFAFVVTKMVGISPLLTLFTVTPLFLTFFIMRAVAPKLYAISRQNQVAVGRLTTDAVETLTNIHAIQAIGAESAFIAKIQDEAQNVYETNIKSVKIRSFLFPIFGAAIGISQLVNLFYGGLLIIRGVISVGDFLAFNIYLGLMAFPLTFIGITLSILQRTKSALERVTLISSTPSEESLSPIIMDSNEVNVRYPVPTNTVLNINKLTFAYASQNRSPLPAGLSAISMNIRHGEKIGIYGSIGSGKSTLMNLIFRIHNPAKDSISLLGKDVLHYSLHDLRSQIGYAPQIAEFFSESIEANLRFGLDRAVTADEIQGALTKARIFDEVLQLPQGLHTTIGEKGVKLSGGQKQRLALARIFLRRYKILLLDDPFASIDKITEAKILSDLHQMSETIMICAHSFKSLAACHRIYLMHQGRLVDQGSYSELITKYPGIGTKGHAFG